MTASDRRQPSTQWGIRTASLIFSLCLAACGSPATPLPAAADVLAQAAQAMQSLSAVHFVIERSGAPAYVDERETIIFRRAEGDFSAPDRARASVRVIGPALVAEVSVISIGDEYWETNPFTGEWGSYSGMGYNPAKLFEPEAGLAAFMRSNLGQLQLTGLETIDTGPAAKLFHLTAQAPGEPVMAMTADLVGRGHVLLDWWIEPGTFYVIRLRVSEPETDSTDPTVWIIDFDSFNTLQNIVPPTP
jgi:hypothetical protein